VHHGGERIYSCRACPARGRNWRSGWKRRCNGDLFRVAERRRNWWFTSGSRPRKPVCGGRTHLRNTGNGGTGALSGTKARTEPVSAVIGVWPKATTTWSSSERDQED